MVVRVSWGRKALRWVAISRTSAWRSGSRTSTVTSQSKTIEVVGRSQWPSMFSDARRSAGGGPSRKTATALLRPTDGSAVGAHFSHPSEVRPGGAGQVQGRAAGLAGARTWSLVRVSSPPPVRCGGTVLYGAIAAVDGAVTGSCSRRRRARRFCGRTRSGRALRARRLSGRYHGEKNTALWRYSS